MVRDHRHDSLVEVVVFEKFNAFECGAVAQGVAGAVPWQTGLDFNFELAHHLSVNESNDLSSSTLDLFITRHRHWRCSRC